MDLEFDHIALSSTNIAEDIEFYRSRFSKIGILYQDDSWAFLEVGGVKIALVSPGEHPPHIAFRVKSRELLEQMATANNTAVRIHRDRSESIYLNDPSGNAIEIVFYPKKPETIPE
jgi:catechol-2,3-dioxygenase